MVKTNSFLFLVILAFLFPGIAGAEDQALEEAHAVLSKRATTKRAAIIKLTVMAAPNRKRNHFGAFISADGLALVDMASLASKKEPEVFAAGNVPLSLGAILGIFPDPGLALIKFKHRPKEWVPLSPEEQDLDNVIAIVAVNPADPWDAKIPPVIGPVLAKRSGLTLSYKVPRFSRTLSIGSGLSFSQRPGLLPGVIGIDREGRLVGCNPRTVMTTSQTLVHISSVASLANDVSKLSKGEKSIPRVEVSEHVDSVVVDDDFTRLGAAIQQQNEAMAQAVLGKLLERHPKSLKLRIIAASEPLLTGDPFAGLTNLRIDPEAPKAEQVALLEARANLLSSADDSDEKIRKLKAAIELSPRNYPRGRIMLAKTYVELNRLEEAEPLFKAAYEFRPDCIYSISIYQLLLYKLRRFEEGDKLQERMDYLGDIYRRK